MRVIVAAIGKLGRGPESEAIARYAKRIDGLARVSSVGPVTIREFEDRSGKGQDAEAELLLGAAGTSFKIILDERGAALRSLDFARKLEKLRDQGAPEIAFLIGGADGHPQAMRDAADLTLSLSAMTWPHGLARLMLLEQIYRAATILAGHPYHRE